MNPVNGNPEIIPGNLRSGKFQGKDLDRGIGMDGSNIGSVSLTEDLRSGFGGTGEIHIVFLFPVRSSPWRIIIDLDNNPDIGKNLCNEIKNPFRIMTFGDVDMFKSNNNFFIYNPIPQEKFLA